MRIVYTALCVLSAMALASGPSAAADDPKPDQSQRFLRHGWNRSVKMDLNAKTLAFTTDEKDKDGKVKRTVAVSRVLLGDDSTFDLTLKNLDELGTDTVEVNYIVGTNTTKAAVLSKNQPSARIAITGDGALNVVHKRGADEINKSALILIVARSAELFSTLNTGVLYTFQPRKTYSLASAFDSSGNVIPGKKVILEARDDQSFTNTINGTYYYVFGEDQQNPIVNVLQQLGTFGLRSDGGTRFGLFLGIGVQTSQSNAQSSFQVGTSFFPDREKRLALSMGLNFAQGDILTSRFKPGDVISSSDTFVNEITRKRWTTGFFISITFAAATTGK